MFVIQNKAALLDVGKTAGGLRLPRNFKSNSLDVNILKEARDALHDRYQMPRDL